MRLVVFVAVATVLALGAVLIWPQIDIVVSGWFYRPGIGFFWRDILFFNLWHFIATAGARVVGFSLIVLTLFSINQKTPFFGLRSKGWLFLLLALLIGPGLVANAVFKDHWGRARPSEVTEFGGKSHFTQALVPSNQCQHNCSFVAGDAAFGFYLPAVAYVMRRPRSRRYFWGGMGLAFFFSLARIAAGAHFLSDVLFAAIFVQATVAYLYRCMYGTEELKRHWRTWMFMSEKSKA